MKHLSQSLIDYEMTLLKAIAACRGVKLTTASKPEAIELLTEALLSPTATAIILSDLSRTEREALQTLMRQGGYMEASHFTRQYGVIRAMGPARLERERPWEKPVNPAERLWYKGLIYKAFQATSIGNQEMVYVPDDMRPLLNLMDSDEEAEATSRSLEVVPAAAPNLIVESQGRLRENVFNLLVYLQTTPVRLQNNTKLTPKDRQALLDCLLPPMLSGFSSEAELDFLLHLGQRAGLLVIKHGRLRPDRDPTRTWLQASEVQQVRFLQNTWRADPTWNDLWHVPGLVPQPTGWENSPLLARAKILDYLTELAMSSEDWLSLEAFVATIKQIDPDFQRPHGDYDSWYIQDAAGRSLMGFANWDKVEGALIRYLVSHILLLLGVTNIGLATNEGQPSSFRLTASGKAFLAQEPITASSSPKPIFLRVDSNFQVHVSSRANLYDRFQMARFAELERWEQNRAIYRITQASVGRALRNGVTADQIVAFLARVTNNQTPLKVVETLRTWGTRQGTVEIERATLLRLKNEALADELRQHPDLGLLLGDILGPTTILVPPDNVQAVRRLLSELGYLTD